MLELHQRAAYRLNAILSEQPQYKRTAYYSVGVLAENEFIVRVAHYEFAARRLPLPSSLPGTTDIRHYLATEQGIEPIHRAEGRWNPDAVEVLVRVSFKPIAGELDVPEGEARAHRHNDILSQVTLVAGSWKDLDKTAVLQELVRGLMPHGSHLISWAFAMYGQRYPKGKPIDLAWVLSLYHAAHRKLVAHETFMGFSVYPLVRSPQEVLEVA